ncbi:kinesin-like protein KIF13B-like protein [Cricetulus griseus]|nr:kinesin-like protein KIF13B-like protein [Cricetulus griseus]
MSSGRKHKDSKLIEGKMFLLSSTDRGTGSAGSCKPVPRILVQPTFSDARATRPEEAQRGSPVPGGALESMVQMVAPAVKICDRPVKVSSSPSTMVATQPPEGQDGPPSPLSEASSGYFSHSVSTATLSETFTLGLDTTGPGNQMPASPHAPSQVTPEPELALLSCTQSHPLAQEEPQELPAIPTQSTELEVPRSALLSEPTSPVPSSPFRIRKVRTSELKSFTGMLGGTSCGAEENPLASEELSNAGGQAPGRLEVTSDSEEASEVPEWLREGEYVVVGTNKTGIVRYIGPTDFQEGTWIGVELDLPSGKNDGSIGGKQYFRCNPGYGLLVRPGRVRRAAGPGRRRSAGLQPQGASEVRRSATISGSATNLASLTAALAKGDRSHKNPENRKSWAS